MLHLSSWCADFASEHNQCEGIWRMVWSRNFKNNNNNKAKKKNPQTKVRCNL